MSASANHFCHAPRDLQSLDCRALHDSERDRLDLEKQERDDMTPFSGLHDDSSSEQDVDLLPHSTGRGRLAFKVLSGFAAAMLGVWMIWPVADTMTAKVLRGSHPLPGIWLRPGSQALPGLPRAEVPHDEQTERPIRVARADIMHGRYELEVPSKPFVVVAFLIESLDYQQLMEHSNFLALFNATVKQAVASVASNNVDSEDVMLALSAGSVVVECAITVPTAVVAESVKTALESSHRLSGDLAQNLEALVRIDMFQSISMGRVMVARMSTPVIHGTTKPPSSTTSLTKSPPSTLPTSPPPTTTAAIAQTCWVVGESCFVSSECCSSRCMSSHTCGTSMTWL
mmetsp:Transcript_135267/g.342265  ORF Transcript_135267/g.342265 Transcript_135267/m.342265 type:complete len:342 (+) Transcript_135267:59-1084(+)